MLFVKCIIYFLVLTFVCYVVFACFTFYLTRGVGDCLLLIILFIQVAKLFGQKIWFVGNKHKHTGSVNREGHKHKH